MQTTTWAALGANAFILPSEFLTATPRLSGTPIGYLPSVGGTTSIRKSTVAQASRRHRAVGLARNTAHRTTQLSLQLRGKLGRDRARRSSAKLQADGPNDRPEAYSPPSAVRRSMLTTPFPAHTVSPESAPMRFTAGVFHGRWACSAASFRAPSGSQTSTVSPRLRSRPSSSQ